MFVLAAFLPPLSLLCAQVVNLRVVEDSTRQPLPGVVVRIATGSRVVATGLTGETGRVTLRVPAAGAYELTAARIGYEGFGPIAIDISEGAQSSVVVMPRTARMLPPIVVTSGSGCAGASGGGTAAAALWEEVRTALTANALTASEGRVQLRVVRFERDLTPDRVFLRERIVRRHVTTGQPFVAEDPAQLLARGFVYSISDSVHYAAPDAALLLHDEFVQAHCFSARGGGPPGAALGLSFAPVPGRTIPDVSGTLWLDEASHELRHLEFQYTGLNREQGLGGPGGRIDFQRLADGSWIVRDWSLAMPVVGRFPPSAQAELAAERYRLLGWLVAGGRAVADTDRRDLGDQSTLVSTVKGAVLDSLMGGPLVGAMVSLDGEPDSIGTDASGKFTLAVHGSGPRVLRVRHDRLGLVPDNSSQEVVLAPDHPADVLVTVPPVARFARTLCGGKSGETGVLGIVRGTDSIPREGVEVRATWFSRGRTEHIDKRDLDTRTVARGVFTFCDLPATGVTLELDGVKTSVRLEYGKYRWVELSRGRR